MANNPISVVIPTYKNVGILRRCLDHLARQTHTLSLMEVVVVVDGSRDGSVELLTEYARTAPFRLIHEFQENAGPGPARNRGLRLATHDVVLIINDDFLLEPDAVAKHAAWHGLHPQREYVLLGFVEEPQPETGDFNMSRLDKAFNSAKDQRELKWNNFWTTNISLKKRFLEETGERFSNRFPHPIHEDVELGYRLGRHGLRLFMDPTAKGLHDHIMSYEQYVRRAYQSGICLAVFYQLHPELKNFLIKQGLVSARLSGRSALRSRAAKWVLNEFSVPVYEGLARFFCKRRHKRAANFFYSRLFGYYQRRGVEAGLQRYLSDGRTITTENNVPIEAVGHHR